MKKVFVVLPAIKHISRLENFAKKIRKREPKSAQVMRGRFMKKEVLFNDVECFQAGGKNKTAAF